MPTADAAGNAHGRDHSASAYGHVYGGAPMVQGARRRAAQVQRSTGDVATHEQLGVRSVPVVLQVEQQVASGQTPLVRDVAPLSAGASTSGGGSGGGSSSSSSSSSSGGGGGGRARRVGGRGPGRRRGRGAGRRWRRTGRADHRRLAGHGGTGSCPRHGRIGPWPHTDLAKGRRVGHLHLVLRNGASASRPLHRTRPSSPRRHEPEPQTAASPRANSLVSAL